MKFYEVILDSGNTMIINLEEILYMDTVEDDPYNILTLKNNTEIRIKEYSMKDLRSILLELK